ncbi:hypothetical protein [Streptomyces benahoarensis]|uniref:Uncharacterized protein n=1 Tax=Streptomyces benahoarensis TaxID=2595054 RepID=A0A553ZL33_9ACTN|nr:hypothetical protein [Streptomyces benahoarensis]TSB18169.1 hypothetical protein FNJ62_24945 [Streptomyces benahoarensis]TSB42188.1 hypothetical protein FNZ23_11280 [Streptomyces benahoarensis]
MIVISLGPERRVDPGEDELGRDRVGYGPTMSPTALYDACHGTWHLGERAQRERFALMTCDGVGVLAVAIDRVEPAPGGDEGREGARRSVIHGAVLTPGHAVHDAYVGKPSPLPPQRNPVGYFDAPEERSPCLCGCGEGTPAGKDFVTGHDQTAVHDRIRQLGGVRGFLAWFDRAHGHWPGINVIYEPVTLDGTPTGKPPRRRHLAGCDHHHTDDAGRILNPIRPATREEMASLPPCKDCVTAAAKAASGG